MANVTIPQPAVLWWRHIDIRSDRELKLLPFLMKYADLM
jgi:hypothetical protein